MLYERTKITKKCNENVCATRGASSPGKKRMKIYDVAVGYFVMPSNLSSSYIYDHFFKVTLRSKFKIALIQNVAASLLKLRV